MYERSPSRSEQCSPHTPVWREMSWQTQLAAIVHSGGIGGIGTGGGVHAVFSVAAKRTLFAWPAPATSDNDGDIHSGVADDGGRRRGNLTNRSS
jgi:hypothetical protein